FCPSRVAVAQRPVGKVGELYGGGHWEYLTEDLFPAVAAQPLNSNPRGLKKIRRCYALTRTHAGQLRHTKSICWRVRLRPPCSFLRIHGPDSSLEHYIVRRKRNILPLVQKRAPESCDLVVDKP